MLLFGKWLCCFESSIATDEWSHMIIYIKGFPYPVGKLSNTSPPLRNSATAFSCCGLRFWTPNVGRINLHGNQSEPLPGFREVTPPDSIIAQCLQTSLSRDFRLLFNKHRSAASQIRYQVLSVLALLRNVVHPVAACIDLLILCHCLKLYFGG